MGERPADRMQGERAGCIRSGLLLISRQASRHTTGTAFPDPALLEDWGRVLEMTGRAPEAEEAYRRARLLK
jgi:hypothetical protein